MVLTVKRAVIDYNPSSDLLGRVIVDRGSGADAAVTGEQQYGLAV